MSVSLVDVPLPGFDLDALTRPSAQLAPMSDDDARWIRRNVWTEHHRKWNGGQGDWFRCRCQWGPSGACERGDHRSCAVTGADRPVAGPDTYLTVSGRKRLHVPVWLADRVCAHSCTCRCGHRKRATGLGPEIDAVFERVRESAS